MSALDTCDRTHVVYEYDYLAQGLYLVADCPVLQ